MQPRKQALQPFMLDSGLGRPKPYTKTKVIYLVPKFHPTCNGFISSDTKLNPRELQAGSGFILLIFFFFPKLLTYQYLCCTCITKFTYKLYMKYIKQVGWPTSLQVNDPFKKETSSLFNRKTIQCTFVFIRGILVFLIFSFSWISFF